VWFANIFFYKNGISSGYIGRSEYGVWPIFNKFSLQLKNSFTIILLESNEMLQSDLESIDQKNICSLSFLPHLIWCLYYRLKPQQQ
jgi:hypothetical protein